MIICDACDLGYDLQCLGDTDSANDPNFNVLEDDCLGHVVLVMLAVMTLKQMAATMKVLAQIRVPNACQWREPAPAQQQCQKFDVYLLENYFAYVY